MRKYFSKFIILLAVLCLLLPAGNSQAKKKSSTYASEGTAFHAFSGQTDGTSPVYRFFSSKKGDHFYVMSDSTPPKDYKSEGVAFYAYSSQASGTSPVYRFLSSRSEERRVGKEVSTGWAPEH